MSLLPSVLSRPMLDAYVDARTPSGSAGAGQTAGMQLLQAELSAGVPATIGLDAAHSLVLAVPLGVAGIVLSADPLAVVVDTSAPIAAASLRRDLDAAWPRLTLVSDGRIAETAPVVAGLPVRFSGGARAAVEVVVDRLVLTAGSLRSPGRFGSQIVLRWRDLSLAADAGPPASAGDPAVSRLTASRG